MTSTEPEVGVPRSVANLAESLLIAVYRTGRLPAWATGYDLHRIEAAAVALSKAIEESDKVRWAAAERVASSAPERSHTPMPNPADLDVEQVVEMIRSRKYLAFSEPDPRRVGKAFYILAERGPDVRQIDVTAQITEAEHRGLLHFDGGTWVPADAAEPGPAAHHPFVGTVYKGRAMDSCSHVTIIRPGHGAMCGVGADHPIHSV